MTSAPKTYRIALGCDHGGYELKESLKGALGTSGHEVQDCGTHSSQSVDYPEFAHAVAKRVSTGEADVGIVVKKGLASGHLEPEPAIRFVLGTPGVGSLVVGSLTLEHLEQNVEVAARM